MASSSSLSSLSSQEEVCPHCGLPQLPDKNVVFSEDEIRRILYNAIYHNQPEIIEEMLNRGVDPNIKIPRYHSDGFYNKLDLLPLISSAMFGKAWDIVLLLLRKCVDLPDMSEFGRPLASIIVKSGNIDLVKYFFEEYCHKDIPIREFAESNSKYSNKYELQRFILNQLIPDYFEKEGGNFEIMKYLVDKFPIQENVIIKLIERIIDQAKNNLEFYLDHPEFEGHEILKFLISKVSLFRFKHPVLYDYYQQIDKYVERRK